MYLKKPNKTITGDTETLLFITGRVKEKEIKILTLLTKTVLESGALSGWPVDPPAENNNKKRICLTNERVENLQS